MVLNAKPNNEFGLFFLINSINLCCIAHKIFRNLSVAAQLLPSLTGFSTVPDEHHGSHSKVKDEPATQRGVIDPYPGVREPKKSKVCSTIAQI